MAKDEVRARIEACTAANRHLGALVEAARIPCVVCELAIVRGVRDGSVTVVVSGEDAPPEVMGLCNPCSRSLGLQGAASDFATALTVRVATRGLGLGLRRSVPDSPLTEQQWDARAVARQLPALASVVDHLAREGNKLSERDRAVFRGLRDAGELPAEYLEVLAPYLDDVPEGEKS